MESSILNTTNFNDSFKNALDDLTDITNENNQVVDDVKKYRNEMENLINSSTNEFANLNPDEINEKLDNILNDVLIENQVVIEINPNESQTEIVQDNSESKNGSGEELEEHFTKEDMDEKINELTQMNNQLNESLNNFMNILNTNKENDNSDNSTINPDDLETESESENDLEEEYEPSKIKNSKSENQVSSIPDDLFKLMETQMANLNINDMFANLQNMPNMQNMPNIKDMANLQNFDNPEKLKMMEDRMKVMSEQLKGFNFENMFQMMGQLNPEVMENKKDETEDLSSFLVDDNDDNEDNEDNEDKNKETYKELEENSETDSYYETDNEDNTTENKTPNIMSNLGVFSKIFSMFGLSTTVGKNVDDNENIISKSLSNNKEDKEDKDENKSDSDIDYDENRDNSEFDRDTTKTDDLEDKTKINTQLNEYLNQNRQMFDDVAKMMSGLRLQKPKTD
jgi:hypothetical protein